LKADYNELADDAYLTNQRERERERVVICLISKNKCLGESVGRIERRQSRVSD
jgi:hypothetical protein